MQEGEPKTQGGGIAPLCVADRPPRPSQNIPPAPKTTANAPKMRLFARVDSVAILAPVAPKVAPKRTKTPLKSLFLKCFSHK